MKASRLLGLPLLAGWLNLLGQIASVSSVTFLLSNLIGTMVGLGTGINGGEAFVLSSEQVGHHL
jgi:hypothetical protein